MISIEQWRVAIGSFQVVITCGCPTEYHDVGVYARRIFVLSVLWCSFVVCTVCLYNVCKILVICSNDVELNPGPVIYRTCPNCGNKAVHIKKKSCPCGYIIRSKTGKRYTASSASGATDNNINIASPSTGMCNKDRDTDTADTLSNSGYPFVAECTVVDDTITKSTSVVDASDIESASIGNSAIDNCIKSAGVVSEDDSVSVSIDDNIIDNAINKSAGVVDADDSMSASIDNSVKTEYVPCAQDSGKGQTISKWDKYKTDINRNRRKKYKLDPECEKARSYKFYHSNPSPVKQRSYKAYHAHPSLVKRRVLGSYYKAHESVNKNLEKSTNFFAKT